MLSVSMCVCACEYPYKGLLRLILFVKWIHVLKTLYFPKGHFEQHIWRRKQHQRIIGKQKLACNLEWNFELQMRFTEIHEKGSTILDCKIRVRNKYQNWKSPGNNAVQLLCPLQSHLHITGEETEIIQKYKLTYLGSRREWVVAQ